MTKRGIWTLVGLAVVAVTAVLLVLFTGSSDDANPEPTATYVIALDPGHGGSDPGATVDEVYEKDLNLEIAAKVAALLEADPTYAVVRTRILDVSVSLEDRIATAENAGAIVYVSVHVNAFSTSEAYGVETLVDSTRDASDDSWVLAELIQDGVVQATGARDRGTRAQESYLQRTALPAVSVETGYLTNDEERVLLLDSAYQELIAQGIVQGIRAFVALRYGETGSET